VISETVDAVQARIKGKGFPYPVIVGPETFKREGFMGAIVIERDLDTGDRTQLPIGWKRVTGDQAEPAASRAIVMWQRRVAVIATIYARSSKAGARANEHQVECDRVRDGVLCALTEVFAAHFLEVIEDRYVKREELTADTFKALETWPGFAARIRFSVLAPVRDVNYQGHGPLTGVVERVTPPIVSQDGFPDYDPNPSD